MNTPEARPAPLDEYQSRLRARQAVVAACESMHARLALMRLAIFAAAAALAWLAFGRHGLSPLWLLVPLALFVAVAIWHDRVLTRRDRASRAVRFYERGLSRLSGTWPGTGATGERFLQPDHPYAADLDLFGQGSVFELLTTARIRSGEETLAGWLLTPGVASDLRARHEAIGELTPRLDLREDLALLGERLALHPGERAGGIAHLHPGIEIDDHLERVLARHHVQGLGGARRRVVEDGGVLAHAQELGVRGRGGEREQRCGGAAHG